MGKRKGVFAVPAHLKAGAKVEVPPTDDLDALMRSLEEAKADADKLMAATVFAGEQKARADQAEYERDEARRQLRAEQDMHMRLTARFVKALGGSFEGSWEDECLERLRAVAKGAPTSSFTSSRVVSEPGSGSTITVLQLTPEAAAGLTTGGATLPGTKEGT